ncbi:ADE_G0013220.mRNA.1.CDS.1 [Saccharomyces cerevisiae]|nr:ADE_G0013220.mRNA.1.CDS.1 [Saccharomyces cerevisiae]CAI4384266.1 BCE_3a_G0013560.mRNA.1.CDS.1 [Saccharomyces cerevisiae]CAI6587479.1 ADE_G0013220.mRNA.1.CDS.1 [Saccharomyces cerevisiae]CAI7086667.1 BCE_3a_G0013560.mRNA.1.CDS.1 [Saccharomyces cerevisiae]
MICYFLVVTINFLKEKTTICHYFVNVFSLFLFLFLFLFLSTFFMLFCFIVSVRCLPIFLPIQFGTIFLLSIFFFPYVFFYMKTSQGEIEENVHYSV